MTSYEEPAERLARGVIFREALPVQSQSRGRRVDSLLIVSDVLVIMLGFAASSVLYHQGADWGTSGIAVVDGVHLWWNMIVPVQFVVFFGIAVVSVAYFCSRGHYTRRKGTWDALKDIMYLFLLFAAAEIVVLETFAGFGAKGLSIILSWAGMGLILVFFRVGSRKLLMKWGLWLRPTVIVGSGEAALSLARSTHVDKDLGLDVTHLLRLDSGNGNRTHPEFIDVGRKPIPVIAPNDLVHELYSRFREHVILICPSPEEFEDYHRLMPALSALHANVGLALPGLGFGVHGLRVQTLFKQDTSLLWVKNKISNPIWRFWKRLFDILASALLLVILSPLMAALAAYLYTNGGSVFYGQKRIGYKSQSFVCYKFRTMVANAEKVITDFLAKNPEARREWEAKFKLKNDPRVTRFGSILRSTSLDELPQLWNVLKGEMTLVGPRPIVKQEMSNYGEDVGYYLSTQPGITGLWQISGRNNTSYGKRVALDRWYICNWSLWYDIMILFHTVRAVITRAGAY